MFSKVVYATTSHLLPIFRYMRGIFAEIKLIIWFWPAKIATFGPERLISRFWPEIPEKNFFTQNVHLKSFINSKKMCFIVISYEFVWIWSLRIEKLRNFYMTPDLCPLCSFFIVTKFSEYHMILVLKRVYSLNPEAAPDILLRTSQTLTCGRYHTQK